ncbi:hypothetical protein FB451DRAFT_1379774 [Mycena latifolia]|nr:hypothetical protein FB451DRAFT_1379774 [Mycena latifolia]
MAFTGYQLCLVGGLGVWAGLTRPPDMSTAPILFDPHPDAKHAPPVSDAFSDYPGTISILPQRASRCHRAVDYTQLETTTPSLVVRLRSCWLRPCQAERLKRCHGNVPWGYMVLSVLQIRCTTPIAVDICRKRRQDVTRSDPPTPRPPAVDIAVADREVLMRGCHLASDSNTSASMPRQTSEPAPSRCGICHADVSLSHSKITYLSSMILQINYGDSQSSIQGYSSIIRILSDPTRCHGRLFALLATLPVAPPPELDGAVGSDTWERTLGSIGRLFSRARPLPARSAHPPRRALRGLPLASVSSALEGGWGGGAGTGRGWLSLGGTGAAQGCGTCDIAPRAVGTREVEVNAFAVGGACGESFVEGYALALRAFRRALAGAHYAPVLPMVANGSRPSFRSSMPVRAVAGLGDEGSGRLRRKMRHRSHKQLVACSPRARGGDDVEVSVPRARSGGRPPSKADSEVFLRVRADRDDHDVAQRGLGRVGVDARDEPPAR